MIVSLQINTIKIWYLVKILEENLLCDPKAKG